MSKEINNLSPVASDIKQLIEQSKQNVALAVNAEITLLYWKIGRRINQELPKDKRAEYGKQIVATLWRQLEMEYGNSFSEKNLRRMMQFAETFPDEKIVVSLIRQLSWTHIKSLIYIEDTLKRNFYIEVCNRLEWSASELQQQINSLHFENTVNDTEADILVELQRSIIELGSDFAFMGRQKRITIDNQDYYIDLLFYHRRLKCMVAIDLRIWQFEADNKDQMELYLRYLEKHEQAQGENAPIGLILCPGKNEEQMVLLQSDKSNIKVADYLTILPSQELLLEKLNEAIEITQNKTAQKNDE